MFKRFILARPLPGGVDAGLLALRLIAPTSLLLKHGIEKVFDFPGVAAKMTAHHTYVQALGVTPSLICAMLADGVLTVMLILGVATRWAALFSVINLLVAWIAVNHMTFFTGSEAGHGEMIVAYIAAMLTLAFAGAGRYSVDGLLEKRS